MPEIKTMLLTDKLAKTVLIPTRLKDGKLINQVTGEEFAGVANNTFIELALHAFKITDKHLLQVLSDERDIEFFPADTPLLANVSDKHIPDALKDFALTANQWQLTSSGMFVEFRLLEPLFITMRGTKMPRLHDCPCDIPALKTIAESVNHAYSLISTAFEPHRRSHSGNVFQKVFCNPGYADKKYKNVWTELESLRIIKNVEYFDELKEMYQTLKGGLFD